MEELSSQEFARLTEEEKALYLQQLLGQESVKKDLVLDSNDDEFFPVKEEQSELSDDDGIVKNRDSEVEMDDDVEETEEIEESSFYSYSAYFVSKDKTEWSRYPTSTEVRDFVHQKCGPHRCTETFSTCTAFKCIFTSEMVDLIIRHTNKRATVEFKKYNDKYPTKKQLVWKDVTSREMYAFMGTLLMSGTNNSNTDHTSDMWKTTGYPIYRATMGLNRFWNILRFIRFDDCNTREARFKEDKAAPIRELWTMLNSNLSKLYRPSECLTIHEQLFPYRGRTNFTQYIPSKSAKYGIKVWWLCDSENSYPLHGKLYTGNSAASREANQGERVVKELVAFYKGSGRNITMDKFFTSLPLAEHLLTWNLTVVGTLKKIKNIFLK